ncbi:MAG: PAS domain S-box protein, partial [Gemmatimonadetes bacterium]|nr:PAS domain S-box protein [Gemmatimonadota bacterium]
MLAIFDSISDGVIVADEKGNLTFNQSAERIIGGRVDTVLEQRTEEYSIFYPDKVTPIPTEELPLVRALRGEATDEMEMFIRTTAKPEGVYISANGRPIASPGTTAHGGVIVFRDVTERVRAEEALVQAFAQGRLEVMDTILHNIGNAITSVAIGVGTLKEQLVNDPLIERLAALSEAVKAHAGDWDDYVQHDPQGQQVRPFLLALAADFVEQNRELIRTVERVNSQTSHIVDIVRAQRGFDSKAMTSKDVDLRQAISGALKIVQDSFASRGIRTHVDCGNAPEEIRIQETQFNQMLVNLLKNAMEAIDELKKSGGLKEQPRIEIRVCVQQDFLVLEVEDNGIGI